MESSETAVLAVRPENEDDTSNLCLVGPYSDISKTQVYVPSSTVKLRCLRNNHEHSLPVLASAARQAEDGIELAMLLEGIQEKLSLVRHQGAGVDIYFHPTGLSDESVKRLGWTRLPDSNILHRNCATIDGIRYAAYNPDLSGILESLHCYIGLPKLDAPTNIRAIIGRNGKDFLLFDAAEHPCWPRMNHSGDALFATHINTASASDKPFVSLFDFETIVSQLSSVRFSDGPCLSVLTRATQLQGFGREAPTVMRLSQPSSFFITGNALHLRPAAQAYSVVDHAVNAYSLDLRPVLFCPQRALVKHHVYVHDVSDLLDPAQPKQSTQLVTEQSIANGNRYYLRDDLDRLSVVTDRKRRFHGLRLRLPLPDILLYSHRQTFEDTFDILTAYSKGLYTERFSIPHPWSLLPKETIPLISAYLRDNRISADLRDLHLTLYPTDWNLTPQSPNIFDLMSHLASHSSLVLLLLQTEQWREVIRSACLQALAGKPDFSQHEMVRLLEYLGPPT